MFMKRTFWAYKMLTPDGAGNTIGMNSTRSVWRRAMLRRKAIQQLKEWKRNKKKKCLIVQGARQVGKTFAVKQFAAEEYEELLEINFKETPSAMEIFSGDLSVEAMCTAIQFRYPELALKPEKTLIFLDEIQECPEAITSLKFWAVDDRFDVIASGSLLGIDYRRSSSYPVGYVDHIRMTGLDFEEFLWGMGIPPAAIDGLREYFDRGKPVPTAVHHQMMEYFRKYIAIGGMPEIVWAYVCNRDFREVDRLQKDLLQGYLYDIAHYAPPVEKVKAEKCYLSLARQLLDKENHKFQYKEIEPGARAQKYYSSVEWLLRADMVQLCRKVTDVRYDLEDYAQDDFFRAYPTDLSLLIGMRDYGLKQLIVENSLTGNTKGGIYECAIADVLQKKGYRLYFYKNETTRKELDFLVQSEGTVIPIEVKGGNAKAASLGAVLGKWPEIRMAYKFMDGNVGARENGILSLPLYLSMFL